MTPDPAPLAMTCLLANPRRLRRLTQQKSYSSIAFILRICKNVLNAFNKPIEKWNKQIWDQLQSWGYAGCTSSWVSLNLTTCRTKAAWQKQFLPTDSVLPLGHQHTPHTLSPNMSVPMMDDLVVLGYPRDHSLRCWRQHGPWVKVDSQPSGISQTYNHLAPRKRNLQSKREKKSNPWRKGLSYWVYHIWWPSRFHHANQGAPHLLGEYPWRRCLKKLHQSLVLGRLLCRLLTYRYL